MVNTRKVVIKKGILGQEDDSSDWQYWQSVSDEERFKVAWELVKTAWVINGRDENELRFQRSVEVIRRGRR